jgi:hypothetical protein
MCRGDPATAQAGGPIAATNSNVVTTTIMGVCYIEVWGLLFGLAWPCGRLHSLFGGNTNIFPPGKNPTRDERRNQLSINDLQIFETKRGI